MKTTPQLLSFKSARLAILATCILPVAPNAAQSAPPPVDPATHAAHVASGTMPADPSPPAQVGTADPALSRQISDLRAKVAQLEAALGKNAPSMAAAPAGAAMAGMPAAPPAASPPMGMDKMKSGGPMGSMVSPGGMPGMNASTTPPASAGMGGGMPMMGMMDKMMGMMDKMMGMEGSAMPAGGAPMAPMGGSAAPAPPAGGGGMAMMGMGKMGMDKMGMAGMMGMSPMGGGASGAMSPSVLPGFPGASHLYHIGATDFFLDHPQHITLSTEQTAALNKGKEQALLAKSTADRAVEQAEQELWMLTSSDQPDAVKIEAKIRQTEKLTGDARLAFVRSIGEASKLLTDEQRKILTGFASPAPAMSAAGNAAPMAPMKGM